MRRTLPVVMVAALVVAAVSGLVGGNDRVNGGPQTDSCTAEAGDMVSLWER
jgi:hypothetical protein